MIKYGINVRELLERTIIVNADSIEDAIYKVEKALERGEIVLDVDDYSDRKIVPSEYWKDGVVPEDADVNCFDYLEDKKKACISLKALYDAGHRELRHGGQIEYTKEDENEYYDLRRNGGSLLCDGEEVEIVKEYRDSVFTETIFSKIWFTLEEFRIATFQ